MAKIVKVRVLDLPRLMRAFSAVSKIGIEDQPKKVLYTKLKYRAFRNAERCGRAIRAFQRKWKCTIMEKKQEPLEFYVRADESREFQRYLREHDAILRHYAQAVKDESVFVQGENNDFRIRCRKEDEERAKSELSELDKRFARAIRLQRERQWRAEEAAKGFVEIELMEYDPNNGEDLPGNLVASWIDEIQLMFPAPLNLGDPGVQKADDKCFQFLRLPLLSALRSWWQTLKNHNGEHTDAGAAANSEPDAEGARPIG